jgi:hypothetical protein
MRFDTQHGPWASDGPSLKLEFLRIREKRLKALTLVIDTEHGITTTVSWCVSQRGTLADAMRGLRVREEATLENIGRATIAADAGALKYGPSEAGIAARARTKMVALFDFT